MSTIKYYIFKRKNPMTENEVHRYLQDHTLRPDEDILREDTFSESNTCFSMGKSVCFIHNGGKENFKVLRTSAVDDEVERRVDAMERERKELDEFREWQDTAGYPSGICASYTPYPNPKPFKVDDIVSCITPTTTYKLIVGEQYKITAIKRVDDTWMVTVDGVDFYLSASHFSNLNPKPFEVGEEVVCTSSYGFSYLLVVGKYYKITQLSFSGVNWMVKVEGMDSHIYSGRFEKVIHEIPKQFVVGQMVRIRSPGTNGVYTITEVSERTARGRPWVRVRGNNKLLRADTFEPMTLEEISQWITDTIESKG